MVNKLDHDLPKENDIYINFQYYLSQEVQKFLVHVIIKLLICSTTFATLGLNSSEESDVCFVSGQKRT